MPMTIQQIFNHVSTHLLTQAKLSIRNTGCACAYRGDGNNGISCAAGCLIADKDYDILLEGKSITSYPVLMALMNSGVISLEAVTNLHRHSEEIKLIANLQEIHDRAVFTEAYNYSDYPDYDYSDNSALQSIAEKWPTLLVQLAVKYNLDYSVIEPLTVDFQARVDANYPV